jgi:hypothetical protein
MFPLSSLVIPNRFVIRAKRGIRFLPAAEVLQADKQIPQRLHRFGMTKISGDCEC